MKIYKCLGKIKICALWVIVLFVLAGLFIFSDECKNGVMNALNMCLKILIPSLFPFFIISSFISESNILKTITPIFNPITKLILGLEGICIVPVVLSVLGGYPIGAKSINTLYSVGAISKSDVEKLVPVCSAAGPGFLITFIGITMLNSYESGIILFSSQIISVIVLSIISKIIFGKVKIDKENITQNKTTTISEALVNSVNSSVKSASGMCGFVIVFSVLCNILKEGFNLQGILIDVFIAMLEITTGVSNLTGKTSLELLSALTGFGGICVHMQIFRELKNIRFSKTSFYIFRLIQSCVCLFTTKLLLIIFPISTEVFSTVIKPPELSFYSSIIGCIALVVTSLIFILALRKSSKS